MQTETPQPQPPLKRPPLIEAQKTRVREIMSHPVVTARPEMSVESVVELMLTEGLSRLPVVDEDGKLVGIISKTDVIAEQFERGDTSDARLPRGWRRGIPLDDGSFHIHPPEALLAEVMKPATVTVNETTTLAQASEVMALHRLHGVPVLSATGEVTGMLSLLDIVGWVAGLA
jgi:CBS domain-containing protein